MMSNPYFPPLPLAGWQPTRDTIHTYAKLLGRIRRAMTPFQKHWWHITLHAAATGLTTTPIPADGMAFELLLDFTTHELLITTSRGNRHHLPLHGQSAAVFYTETLAVLAGWGIKPGIDQTLFADETPGAYDGAAVTTFWQILAQVDAILKEFKSSLHGETGPVQLFPHHFDLAVTWLSGRLVPGVDPQDEENATELMSFGFSTGDTGISDPYFYAYAYPTPAGMLDHPLPAPAYWNKEGFVGAVLPYEALVTADQPKEVALAYLRAAHEAGSSLMK